MRWNTCHKTMQKMLQFKVDQWRPISSSPFSSTQYLKSCLRSNLVCLGTKSSHQVKLDCPSQLTNSFKARLCLSISGPPRNGMGSTASQGPWRRFCRGRACSFPGVHVEVLAQRPAWACLSVPGPKDTERNGHFQCFTKLNWFYSKYLRNQNELKSDEQE